MIPRKNLRIRLRIADRKDSRSFEDPPSLDFSRISKINAQGSRSRLLIPIPDRRLLFK